jgi:hypothetical protein
MSTETQVAPTASAPKQQMRPNQVLIVGRINYLGGFDSSGKRVHEARIAIPAADQFSHPGAVMVQSSYRLGSIGDDVRVLCEVTGFPDRWTDRTTSEIKQTARIVLRALEQ